jgi:type VII secretion protein EccE
MAAMATDPGERAVRPMRLAPRVAFAVRRRRAAIGDFPAGRVMVVEIAALAAAIAALITGPILRIFFGVVALVLLLVALARRDGRWWLANLPRRSALRHRRRQARAAVATAAASGDSRLVSLAAAAPGAVIRECRDRDTTIGVGQDEKGWYCALVVAPWSSLNGIRYAELTLDRLARVFAETSVPVSTVQVVSYVAPAPAGALDANSALAQSYRELLATDPVLADQVIWVAVRLDPRDAAEAAVSRGGGLDGVDRALATTIARVGKALSEVDVPYQVLDGAALLDAVGGAVGTAPGASGPPADERWQLWFGAGLAQVCFEVADWPPNRPGEFLAGFSRVPAALVSVAVVLSPAEGEVGLRGLIRVGAAPAEIGRVGRAVEDLAKQGGGRVRRLDGEHGPAVYATCPTGGVV